MLAATVFAAGVLQLLTGSVSHGGAGEAAAVSHFGVAEPAAVNHFRVAEPAAAGHVSAGEPAAVNHVSAVAPVSLASPARPASAKPSPTVRRPSARESLVRSTASVLLALAHRTADPAHAGELFAPHSWYSPPPPPPPPPPAPAVEPAAPPLPYTLLGSYTDSDNATVYFVAREDRVYDVKPGDVLDQTYSVAAVEDGKLVFLYKPLNVRQSLPIGAAP